MANSSLGQAVQLRSKLMHGIDTRLRAVVVNTNLAQLVLGAAIGATGVMEVKNQTGEYLRIVGMRIWDDTGNQRPFYVWIETENERQWTQSASAGVGIHSSFLGINGPFGTPLSWKDSDGPGRTTRTWGLRGLAPREVLRLNFSNLSANQPSIRAEFICQTMPAMIAGNIGWNYNEVLAMWHRWEATYQTMDQNGVHGDEPLFTTQGIYKHFPLFDRNMPGAVTAPTNANFGAVAIPAGGESGPLQLPFPSTKEGLVVLHSMFGVSDQDFEFEFFGGGYETTRDGVKAGSAGGAGGFLQPNVGRSDRGFYAEGVFVVPRPYNVQQPPAIQIRNLAAGAVANVRLGFSGISIPRDIWMGGGGSR